MKIPLLLAALALLVAHDAQIRSEKGQDCAGRKVGWTADVPTSAIEGPILPSPGRAGTGALWPGIAP